MMRTKLFPVVVLLSVLALLLGACVAPAPTTTPSPPAPTLQPELGTVAVYVTDAPPDKDVTAVLLTVSSLEIHRAVAEQEQEQDQEGEGEWIIIDISDNMTTFDLLKVKGIEEFFGQAEIEAGKYTQVRLIVDKAEVTTGDNVTEEATVPSGEIKLVRPFDVKAGETTAIILDFDAERSVIFTGSGKIQVKPVVKLSIEYRGQSGKPKEGQEDKGESVAEVSLELSRDDFEGENQISRDTAVPVSGLFVLTLHSNPTTGFQWPEMAEVGDATVLEQLSHEFVAPEGGMIGAAGKEIWTFKAIKEGTTTVFLAYSRPGQGGEQGEWTFELNVVVE